MPQHIEIHPRSIVYVTGLRVGNTLMMKNGVESMTASRRVLVVCKNDQTMRQWDGVGVSPITQIAGQLRDLKMTVIANVEASVVPKESKAWRRHESGCWTYVNEPSSD